MSKQIELKYRVALAVKNINLRDLAEELSISPSYVSDILTGKRNGEKAKEHLKRIDKILNIDN